MAVDFISLQKKQRHHKGLAWLIWSISAIFLLFQFFLQLTSGEIVEGLMKSFSLSAFGGGVLASTYYYIYVSLQTPAGMMVDRFGARKLLSIGALICGLGCFIFGISQHLFIAGLGRLMMGGGAAFAFVGSLNLIGKWFAPEKFALMAAVAETIGMIGSVIGGYYLAEIVHRFGWRESMIGAAGLAVLIAFLLVIFVRNAPASTTSINTAVTESNSTLWQDLSCLLKNRVAWINGIYSGLMFSIVTVFVALWAIPFLEHAHNITLSEAVLAGNMVFIGVAIGGPIFCWIDSKTVCPRRLFFIGGAIISAILLFVIIAFPNLPMWSIFVLMTSLGVFSSAYVLTFVVANEIVPAHMRATSIGLVNTLSVGSAPLLQPVVGFLLNLMTVHSPLHNYSVHDYQVALGILPILVLAAGILGCFLPENIKANSLQTAAEEPSENQPLLSV